MAALSARGVFVSEHTALADDRAWRRLAVPAAAASRDLSLTVAGRRAHLAWSDADGVRVSTLRRVVSPRAGAVRIGEPWSVPVPKTFQPRFPLAAVVGASDTEGEREGDDADADRELVLFWSADGVRLFRTAASISEIVDERAAPPARPPAAPRRPEPQPLELPSVCLPGERLRGLAACAVSDESAWLACVTDRGRVLAAHWDLAYDLHGPWHILAVPLTSAVAITAVRVEDRPVLVVGGSHGELLTANLDTAVHARSAWRPLVAPASVQSGPIAALCAASGARGPWLATATANRIWLASLRDHGTWLACGPVTEIPLGGQS